MSKETVMEINFLENLKEDVRFPLGNRYYLKRYKYWENGKGSWVDRNGKKITERVFSFIIEHGNRWDNSTNFNVLESELNTTMDICNEHLTRIKAERFELLSTERAERKLYPQLQQWKFKNVTISVVSEMKYYDKYPGIGKKVVTIYGNGLRFEYCDYTLPKDFEVTLEWVLHSIINGKVLRYNSCDITKWIKTTKFVKSTKQTVKHSFVPLNFYIGYLIELNGQQIKVEDVYTSSYSDNGFKDGITKHPVTIEQLPKIKIIGELTGLSALVPLMNKVKYC